MSLARPPIEEQAGVILAGKYKLIEHIGQGGMGSVWMAQQQEPVKRLVAVKLIKSGQDSGTILTRFEAERQTLALMDHPNIAKVLDAGTTGEPATPGASAPGPVGRPFFVMELVKGVSITQYCDDHKLTLRQRLELFVPVCQAIQHAHQKGVIHRDIKPSNVLVALYDDRPVPKVIDFGLAKATGAQLTEQTLLTGFGALVGTPQYMSPEQATLDNLDIDTRSDIYSLGVVLYELLAGSPPFRKKELEQAGMLEVLRVIREEEPPWPSTRLSSDQTLPSLAAKRGTEPAKLTRLLRGELDWIVMKALEKERSRRYETANGLAMDIQRYLADEPVLAGPPSAAYRLRKFVKRNKGRVLAGVLVLLALVAGIIGTTIGLVRAEAARQEAEAARQAEAEHAEGERRAKLDAQHAAERERQARRAAQEKEKLAVAAAERERRAKEAEAAQRQRAEQVANLLQGVFRKLDPRLEKKGWSLKEQMVAQLDAVAARLDKEFAEQPLVRAGLRDALGQAQLGLGQAQKAVVLLEQAVAERQKHLGPDHPDTLASMNNLARAYQDAGQLDRALPLLEETLAKRKAKLGPDHPATLTSMNNLAGA
jgi:serine/threonine protein kinase